MKAGRRFGLVLAVAAITGACVSGGRMTLAAKFVREGTPSVDLGGPRSVSTRPVNRNALLREARLAHVPAPSLPVLESNNPELRQALARLQVAPTTANYLEVAEAYVHEGVPDRAHDYLTKSLAVNGPDAAVYDSLARLWRDWGQPGEGLGHAHRSVYFAPLSPVAHNTLGTVLYRLRRTADARASFTRALELDPKAWYALANLCHLNMAAGDTRAAISQCRQAAVLRKAASSTD